jgi:cobalt/nickel transport system permease protein
LVVSFPSRNLSGLVAFCLYPAVFMSLSLTPWGPLLSRLAAALPFALAGALSNLILLRETAFTLGGLGVSQGAVSFVSILLKTVFTVLAALLLVATTSFPGLAEALTAPRALRIIGLQLVMTWRYTGVLLDEAENMVRAYRLRAPASRGVKMGDMGSFAGQLLLRSFDRAGRVYGAMKCRGFSGMYHGKAGARTLTGADWAYMLITAGALLALRLVNISRFFGEARRLFHA